MCRYRCLLVASVAACLALDSMFPAFAGASAKQRQCRAVMLASDEEALAETRATIGMEGDVGRLRAQALNLKWQALVGEEADEA
eukprot:g28262.t1